MKQFLYLLCQWTWGLPQNLVGLALYLYYRMKGCPGSMSMGSFLFMHPTWTPADKELLAHEYGHTIQSLFFGPFYLLTVGVPSILWAGLPGFKKLRRKGRGYYTVYPEKQATRLGKRYAKKAVPRL